MARPDDIIEHFIDEDEATENYPAYKHEWDITWKPIKRWTFDQYGSSDGSWGSEGTITLWESDEGNYRLITETWKGTFMLYTYVDQWGTYYYSEGDLYIASEEGTRSFWIAYLEALKMFSDAAEFKMEEPASETYGETWREKQKREEK